VPAAPFSNAFLRAAGGSPGRLLPASPGFGSEQVMVLGISRGRSRFALAQEPHSPEQAEHSRHWLSERGEIAFEAACDLFGGFPGYAETGGVLEGVRLRITNRYLLVGESEPFGFGLPLRWLDGVALVPLEETADEFGLRLYYQDGASPRLFTIRFRVNRLAMRNGPRAEKAHLALLRGGVDDRFAASPQPDPSFRVPWGETAPFEAETVIWRGPAMAPLRIGGPSAPGELWLTTKSLIWGHPTADGIQRVPLHLLADVTPATLASREGAPALFAGLGDQSTGHFELPFVFNQGTSGDQNLKDRGALLVGLRSRGVPVGAATPRFQPWRIEFLPAALPVEDTASETTLEPIAPTAAEAETGEDEVLAVWHAGPETDVPPPIDIPLASGWSERLSLAIRPGVLWPLAAAYEAATLDLLDRVLLGIRARAAGVPCAPIGATMPGDLEQRAALAELLELKRSGKLSAERCQHRSNRLVLLADTCLRLRTLADLRDAGHLTDADVSRRQRAIIARLSEALLPF
jgi:hypothetical protein